MAISKSRIVVVDDDRTGIQTVHGCMVLMRCDADFVRGALTNRIIFSYLLTNTRVLPPGRAKKTSRTAVAAVIEANQADKQTLIFICRSDSTLRSHFPLKVDEIIRFLAHCTGLYPQAPFFMPTLLEGGRLTPDNTHYLRQDDRWIPTADSEFARDTIFERSTSVLPDSSPGRSSASTVVCLWGTEGTAGDRRL